MAGPISTGPEAESGSVDESNNKNDDGNEMMNVGVGLVFVVVVVVVVEIAGEVRNVVEGEKKKKEEGR